MKLLINYHKNSTRIAITQNGILENFFMEKSAKKSIVGNIYKAKVERVIPALNASFLNFGEEREGFLPIEDFSEELSYQEDLVGEEITPLRSLEKVKKGDEILVQVVKDSIGTKGPKLTTRLSLPGRYLVLLPREKRRGISKRIKEEKERERLKGLLENLVPKQMGIIVRTLSEGQSKRTFALEIRQLLRSWQRIETRARTVSAPSLLHQELSLDLCTIRDLVFTDIDEIVVDSPFQYKNILRSLKVHAPFLRRKVRLYQKEAPLFKNEGIEREVERLFQKRVWLKNGGSIVIEETEALVSIDVNTGKGVRGENVRKAILKTNLEAAKEIARQIRLRNLGGIIIIDFIDMESPSDQRDVHKSLEEELEGDKARINILQISKLGLVEMTRQRTTASLSASHFENCPHCDGTGKLRKQ